ncbi:uncharacterized protein [Palaemon carinicauda]|uniref:uncharacterized protein n=1 Tax=Palaemon carinicauda TaxID=392227 RepID=UPI0035B5EFCB
MMGRAIFGLLILTAFFSEAYGQHRWVWGSRRSERQLDLHRPFLRPAALPPAAAPAPAAAGSISPPAAPFGLVPSASSLVPHGSPPAIGKSSSSSLHGTETQVSAASFELRPRPIEPLVFRPLSIDISKLPLQSSSEVDAFEAAFEPQLSQPSSLSREAVHQDLTRGVPFGRPGHPDPIPGIISSHLFPRDISSVNIDTPAPVRNSQAFVTPPDISILPLEGSSADGRERFEGQPFAESPVGLTQFQVHSPTPSSERLLFPQRISSLEAINKRQEELFRGTNTKRETVMPKPTRIFPNGQTAFPEESPFLKKKFPNGKKPVKEELALSGVQSPRGTIRFPKEIQKFNFVPPSQTFPIDEPMLFGLSSDVSSFALPPPTPTSQLSAFQQKHAREFPDRPTRESREFLRPNRSIAAAKITDLSKPQTIVLKKQLISKKGIKEPTYVWLWPRQAEARRDSSTSPAKHAL